LRKKRFAYDRKKSNEAIFYTFLFMAVERIRKRHRGFCVVRIALIRKTRNPERISMKYGC